MKKRLRNLIKYIFQNVFIQDNGKDLTRNCILSTTQYIEDVSVSKMDVFSALHRLSGKLSLTPDKLPAYFLSKELPIRCYTC